MSLRKKTDEVLQKGEAERAIRQPDAGSVPVRLYNYWASRTTSKVPARENFCHYWRVVAFWAPLAWLTDKAGDFLDSKAGKVFVGLLLAAVLALIITSGAGPAAILAITVGSLLAVLGGVSTGLLLERKYFKPRYSWDEPFLDTPESVKVAKVFAVVGFPGSAIVLALFGLIRLVGKIPPLSSAAKDRLFTGLMFFMGAGLVSIIGFALFNLWLAIGFWTIAVVLGVFGFFVGVAYLAGRAERKHAAKLDAAREYRYNFYEENGFFPTDTKRPTKIGKFFNGAKDLLVFVFQVIRTKKWKICPYVEVPKDGVDAGL